MHNIFTEFFRQKKYLVFLLPVLIAFYSLDKLKSYRKMDQLRAELDECGQRHVYEATNCFNDPNHHITKQVI
jgi:hypothetical protein